MQLWFTFKTTVHFDVQTCCDLIQFVIFIYYSILGEESFLNKQKTAVDTFSFTHSVFPFILKGTMQVS